MDFKISICGFTSESLEFMCQSCSSTNLTSERFTANSNPMWPNKASLHYQGVFIFCNWTTWMTSTSILSHQPSITDSCSLTVVNFKVAFTMSPFRSTQPSKRLLNITLLLKITVFSETAAGEMLLGSLNIPTKGAIPWRDVHNCYFYSSV